MRKIAAAAIIVIIALFSESSYGWTFPSCPHSKTSTTSLFSSDVQALEMNNDSTDSKELLTPSAVSNRVFESDNRPVILFDGVCNLCNGAVNIALDWDPKGNLRFAALQSQIGRALLEKNGRKADDISSIVLVSSEGAYVKSDAILKITEALTPRFLPTRQVGKLGQILIPRILRDLIYDRVANNRYKLMGKRDMCRFDSDGEFEARFVNDSLAYR
mmetsp:Transcript_1137/g.1740  ORF Transcript_1137/g.1740 Transcript_1137/m.1740 type:complete len:216 (-) Transcript_1137:159-806(-)